MGLLDNLESQGLSSLLGGSSNPLVSGLLQMIQNQPGGLQGLVQTFHDKGLGGVVSSWVSTGPNLPISAEQIHGALGNDAINSLAQKAGVAPDMAGSMLAQLLPGFIDKLTPEGKLPESGNLLGQGLNVLKGLKF